MKTFNYKKGKAVIRTLKEPVIKKKKINLDRVLYLLIIMGLLFWVFSFIYKKTAWIEGNGHVLMDKVDVNFTNDIRLKELFINEGDTVFIGKKLFNYFQNDFDSDASLVLKNLEKKEKQNSSLLDMSRQINLKKIQLQGLKSRLVNLEEQQKKVTKLILLDVYTKTKLDDLLSKISLLKNNIELQKNEIYFLNKEKKMLGLNNSNSLTSIKNDNYQNSYISPITGVVGQILKNSEESCYKTENVLTIHNVEKVFIKAYFNLKDIANIKKGNLVQVEFPDKTVSEGIINKLYISTYKAPTEFQKKYEPTERNILTEIIPLDKSQIRKWGKFHKLNLKVKLDKF